MSVIRSFIGDIKYIIAMKGKCSSLTQTNDPCPRFATRFERWDGGDFSISCSFHHYGN